MGRPYEREVERLAGTYDWSSRHPIDDLVAALEQLVGRPAIAVGSGGSLTAAHVAAQLHETAAGSVARAATPLDVLGSGLWLAECGAVVVSAGGRNPDILSAFGAIERREPRLIITLCSDPDSPLARAATVSPRGKLILVPRVGGKDGYLATNSLLSIIVLLTRAYARVGGLDVKVPESLADLLAEPLPERARAIDLATRHLWRKRSLSILHGHASAAGAIDLESKLTESAMAAAHVADFRNFAHGRHLWLAKRGDDTGVLAFASPDDLPIAGKTLALIPSSVDAATVEIRNRGPLAAVESVVSSIILAGSAGRALSVDPGRPTVPTFGRRLYHLSVPVRRGTAAKSDEATHCAIRRKWPNPSNVPTDSVTSLERFRNRLGAADISALVLDYDGTLCDANDRFNGLPESVATALAALIEKGLWVGVATGRGGSAGEALRAALPQRAWNRVIVGYYNGGVVARLSDAEAARRGREVNPMMEAVAQALREDPTVAAMTTITSRQHQVSAELTHPSNELATWQAIADAVQHHAFGPTDVLRSSHAIDVLAPGVSKTSVVECIRESADCGSGGAILCIGDRGRWPGNDARLLSGPFSLSVDEASPLADSCWNLSPPGARGVSATLYYLERMRMVRRRGRLNI